MSDETPPYLNIDRDNHPAVIAGRRSREAVKARDKDAWLAIFAENGSVEDPVGPSMFDEEGVGHRGPEQLSAFWDKTIGTTEKIEFAFDKEIICGDEVAYVGRIVTHIGGHVTDANGVFTYKADANGDLLALRAFWEVEETMNSIRPA
ncbi:nuclear transport factor 2 family protein [Gordonia zhaorongruii]|uniref:nuclear transport factor 2 family protein n=1 Tax=Gordonia zhaorongruii TaxID=2597659 RepID=UPI0010505288|nr:nuclear transport factor 2 family protein [Gordonia zhaorongruii]